jgi:hypothetical protein
LPARNPRKKEKEKKERKEKKIKERKVISSQITPNYDTCATQKERGCQDESNDAAKSRLQPL